MEQYEINQAVARATGESVATIAALGFSLLMLPPESQYLRPSVRRHFQPCRTGKSRQRRPVKRHSKKRDEKRRPVAA